MKKTYLYIMMCLFATASFTACNDYDTAAIGYDDVATDDDPSDDVDPPVIDNAWQLKSVSNNGQFDKKVFVYTDRLYNQMFSRTLGWNGGDVLFSYELPDGNILWGARDSYFGVVDASTRARREDNKVVRTSMLLQTGDKGNPSAANLLDLNTMIQTSDPNAADYYVGAELCPSDKSTRRYFPTLANYYNGKINALFGYYGTTSAQLRYSTAHFEYTLDGTKLVEQSRNTSFNSVTETFDQSQYEDEDGYTYMYASALLNGISGVLVARVPNHNLTAEWEYYVLSTDGVWGWTKDMPSTKTTYDGPGAGAALRSNILADNGECQFPQVLKRDGWYYLFGQRQGDGNEVYIWRSKTPSGPFVDQKTLFVVPEAVEKLGNRYYDKLSRVVLHQSISRQGELVFSTTQQTTYNNLDNFTYPGSADFLRPYFYRVFNWQAIYE